MKKIAEKKLPGQFWLFCILILSVFPILNIFSFGVPTLYLLLPATLFIFLLLAFDRIKMSDTMTNMAQLMLFIIVAILMTSVVGSIGNLGRFVFPTEIMQYIARFSFFGFFAWLFFKGYFDESYFIKYFLIVLNIAMIIGILQWIPWIGRELFIKLYPFRDGSLQLSQLGKGLLSQRLHGFAQHATANGGLASFFAVFGFSVFRYYDRHRLLSLSLIILSIINIVASQARAGMLALGFSVILLATIDIRLSRNPIRAFASWSVSILSFVLLGIYFFSKGSSVLSSIAYRWQSLISSQGGARIVQIKYFFSLMNDSVDRIFGLSKAVVNKSSRSYGAEIEPINIYVSHGLLGLFLQYLLVISLLVYFFRRIKAARTNKALATLMISSFVGLFGYQVFSVGYFFFREIRVGLFPWILMGAAFGSYEKNEINEAALLPDSRWVSAGPTKRQFINKGAL